MGLIFRVHYSLTTKEKNSVCAHEGLQVGQKMDVNILGKL